MIALRAAAGLGDAIHLRAAALHLLERGETVRLFTKFPEVFADLAVECRPLDDGDNEPELRHFNGRLGENPELSAFAAACLRAGLAGPVELKLNWAVKNRALLERVRLLAGERPVLLFQPTKLPKNSDQELLRPARRAYNGFLESHAEHFCIKLGHPAFTEDRGEPCELDLQGQASIPDAFDLGTIADLCFGESCYLPMLGEGMDKRFAIMFTRRALNSSGRMRHMTPARLFHKKHLASAVYDES